MFPPTSVWNPRRLQNVRHERSGRGFAVRARDRHELPRRNRQASSISLHTGIRARAPAPAAEASPARPGSGQSNPAREKSPAVCRPSSSVTPAARNFAARPPSSRFAASHRSPSPSRHTRCAEQRRRPRPCAPAPPPARACPRDRIPASHTVLHLNFKVVSENSANTSATIQNRTMIFDSLHPSSSK